MAMGDIGMTIFFILLLVGGGGAIIYAMVASFINSDDEY